jgi:hypothetical protein
MLTIRTQQVIPSKAHRGDLAHKGGNTLEST